MTGSNVVAVAAAAYLACTLVGIVIGMIRGRRR